MGGDYGEFPDFNIELDEKVELLWKGRSHLCKHAYSVEEDEKGRITAIVPFLVKSHNEGGNNLTIVCAECIIEEVEKIKKDKKGIRRDV